MKRILACSLALGLVGASGCGTSTTLDVEAGRSLTWGPQLERNAIETDRLFSLLMGDEVEPRREFIETHALDVKELDI